LVRADRRRQFCRQAGAGTGRLQKGQGSGVLQFAGADGEAGTWQPALDCPTLKRRNVQWKLKKQS
jgi:hypothetical protein